MLEYKISDGGVAVGKLYRIRLPFLKRPASPTKSLRSLPIS